MKRALKIIMVFALMLTFLPAVQAKERSVRGLNDENQIVNNEESVLIQYEGEEARVFFGYTGIHIVSATKSVHLETEFEVLKLTDAGDVNGDGYTDFLTWQNASNYVDQLLFLSGKDGKVLFSKCITRETYDPNLGTVRTNCYIQQLLCHNNIAYVIYDYNLEAIDLKTGETLFLHTESNNIWKAIIVEDCDGDQVNDVAFSGQDNVLGVISGKTGSEIMILHPATEYVSHYRWDTTMTAKAVMNIWDLAYEKGHLYALSEDGVLFDVDLKTKETKQTVLEVVTQEKFQEVVDYRCDWYGNSVYYVQTGLNNSEYFSYRFAEVTSEYFLIDCFMGDINSLTSAYSETLPSKTVLFNRSKGTVETTIDTQIAWICLTTNSCFAEYEGNRCITVLGSASTDRTARLSVYGMDGTLLKQRDITASFLSEGTKTHLSYNGEAYLLEFMNGGCLAVSADLKDVDYYYDQTAAQMVGTMGEGMIVLYEFNGIKNRLVCYEKGINDVKWQYEVTDTYSNKGFEFISMNEDYNEDGCKDILGIVNSYDSEDVRQASYFIILDGNDGSELHNRNYQTGYGYDERNRRYPTHLTAERFRLIKDFDGDNKKDFLVVSPMPVVISSSRNNIAGYVYGGYEAKGTVLELGDINGDGFSDSVDISDKETRLYLSRTSYRSGYFELSYTKTNTHFDNNPEYKAASTSGLIGDIDRDGVSEIAMVDFNSEDYQTFKIINGKTLETMYHLCEKGLIGENIAFTSMEQDLNGDGYNELWGHEEYITGIYDGKTGQFLLSTKEYFEDDPEIYYEKGYKPEYIVPFTRQNLSEANFTVVSDMNGNHSSEIALLQYRYDRFGEAYELNIYDGATCKLVSSSQLSQNIWYYRIMPIDGDGKLMALCDSRTSSTRVLDLKKGSEVAEYGSTFTNMWAIGSDLLAGRTVNDQIYVMDMEKSFDLTSEVPHSTDDHVLHLSWKPLMSYSLMKVYDNGDVVYVGKQLETDIELMEGDHTITLAMNDGQGKSYMESYNITVNKQKRNHVIPVAVSVACLAAALLFGIGQKIIFKRKFREVSR